MSIDNFGSVFLNLLKGVKRGRYTLEKRATTIKESRIFGKQQSGPTSFDGLVGNMLTPATSDPLENASITEISSATTDSPKKNPDKNIRSPLVASSTSSGSSSQDEVHGSQNEHDLPTATSPQAKNTMELGYQSDGSRVLSSARSSGSCESCSDGTTPIPIATSALDELHALLNRFKNAGNISQTKRHNLKVPDADCGARALFETEDDPTDVLNFALAKADEENLEKLAEQAITAYDRQNFLTKGFLSKIPGYQHTYLVI